MIVGAAALLLAMLTRPAGAIEHDVVVSVYQGPCRDGDLAANLQTVREVIAAARERGSHFLAFPETFLSGYDSREHVEQGTRSLDDPEITSLIADTRSHEMVVLVGLARRDGERLYNSVLVMQQGKLLGTYDKVMLTGGDREPLGFAPGQAVPVFTAHGVKFAAVICHDTSFFYPALAARLQGAELLFTPHYNFLPAAVVDDHRRWVRNCHVGLACQLRMVVARSNVVVADRPGVAGYGDSFILSPQGEPLAEARLFRTELVTARLTPAMFRAPTVWGDLQETPPWLLQDLSRRLAEAAAP
ncbi:MAG: carbon-nitrogen hydrolase family protein [Pirellulales bacterium]|nr:carbon-nitrogen hydrolase family protein [Pirellulales bacterium]